MATAGADAHDIQRALEGVQHMSWAGGGTLRRKNLVLLAFADVSAYSIDSSYVDGLQNHLTVRNIFRKIYVVTRFLVVHVAVT